MVLVLRRLILDRGLGVIDEIVAWRELDLVAVDLVDVEHDPAPWGGIEGVLVLRQTKTMTITTPNAAKPQTIISIASTTP